MSSRKYYRKFKAANKHAFGGKYRALRGVLKKFKFHKRDIFGKRGIDSW